jgi:hypothetical protein
MVKKSMIKVFCAVILSTVCVDFSLANANAQAGVNNSGYNKSAESQKVIDAYKAYVASIPLELRKEIINHRKAIAEINKKKRELYNSLSQEAQQYLEKEQEFKKQLPIRDKKLINIEKPGEKLSSNHDKHNNENASLESKVGK